MPSNGRPPSAAALARKSSYSDLTAAQRNMSRKFSFDRQDASEGRKHNLTLTSHPSTISNKENSHASQSRIPKPFTYANRVPTPNPFAPPLTQWNSDMSLRGDFPQFREQSMSQMSRVPVLSEIHNRQGASHAPNSNIGIRGRKEGMLSDSRRVPDKSTRHDQSLLPPITGTFATSREPRSTATSTPNMLPNPAPASVEIIDVDAIDPDVYDDIEIPSLDATKLSTKASRHKQGTSSTNSLGSVERKVITYVGAEVSRTESMSRETGQDGEADGDTIAVSLGGSIFETAAKRKRRGTVEEQEARKRERGGQGSARRDDEVGMEEVGDVELSKVTDE